MPTRFNNATATKAMQVVAFVLMLVANVAGKDVDVHIPHNNDRRRHVAVAR